jgi:hypothetical protein
MKFLDLVLFDPKFSDSSVDDSQATDNVLQLYAEFRPLSLPRVLLNSWIDEHFTPGIAISCFTRPVFKPLIPLPQAKHWR